MKISELDLLWMKNIYTYCKYILNNELESIIIIQSHQPRCFYLENNLYAVGKNLYYTYFMRKKETSPNHMNAIS